MTVDELIEGYIRLYQHVRKRRSVLAEIFEGIANHGIGVESSVLIGNNLYQKFDSIKKTRRLRQNQQEIAALELPPHIPVFGSDMPSVAPPGEGRLHVA